MARPIGFIGLMRSATCLRELAPSFAGMARTTCSASSREKLISGTEPKGGSAWRSRGILIDLPSVYGDCTTHSTWSPWSPEMVTT